MADCLAYAAAPLFAVMALVTASGGGDHAAMLCAEPSFIGRLGGMTAMYLLMAVVHLVPWLRLLRRSDE